MSLFTDLLDKVTTLRQRVRTLRQRVARLRLRRRYWKTRALEAEDALALTDGDLVLPGHHLWKPEVERWRSLAHYWLTRFGGAMYGANADAHLDTFMGIMSYASGGDPHRISGKEWVGTPPPGYDPNDSLTKASGLMEQVPAYFYQGGRAQAAGFEGRDIFDPDANIGVAAWLLYDGWHPDTAPNWRHWNGAHVGETGSYEWAIQQLEAAQTP